MIPVVVYSTNYTATLNDRVLKLVPCENCSTEYVYFLEREGMGVGTSVGTSVFALNDEGARDNAVSAAEESLREYLENDFDPVPCPVCGQYQRYMFPKLYKPRSPWLAVAQLAVMGLGFLDALGALYWTVTYLQRPSDHALGRMPRRGCCLRSSSSSASGLARWSDPGPAASTRIRKTSKLASKRAGAGPSRGPSSRRRSRDGVPEAAVEHRTTGQGSILANGSGPYQPLRLTGPA